jgi:hypothetical protein
VFTEADWDDENQLASGERPPMKNKRIESPTYTRARLRSSASVNYRELNHARQRRSGHINQSAFASTEASKTRARFGIGLTHRKKRKKFQKSL